MVSPPIPLEPLHRFHSYCARFPSELVEAAVDQYTRRGDSVYDPFCGSGTTLVAGLARGRRVVGSDVDPLAGLLSTVKCQARSQARYAAWRDRFVPSIERAIAEVERRWPSSRRVKVESGAILSVGALRLTIPTFPELNYWFPPRVVVALAAIAAVARACRDRHHEQVALVSLSASLIAKWPHTLSYAMDIDHTRPHRRVQRIPLDRVLTTYVTRLDRTIACLGKLHAAYAAAGLGDPDERPALVAFPHDAREPLATVAGESQAAVITSPPYFNAVDYPRSHRISVCWMNGYAPADLASRRRYIGLRHAGASPMNGWLADRPAVRRLIPAVVRESEAVAPRLTGFFADLDAVLRQAWRTLRPGGRAVLVIADNVVKGSRVPTHRVVEELGRSNGFDDVTSRQRRIDKLRRRYPVGPFGFDGPMTHEHLVVMRKPK